MKQKSKPCPTCKKKLVLADGEFFPFCSERCKLIDLGHWFDGNYTVPDETTSPPSMDDPEL